MKLQMLAGVMETHVSVHARDLAGGQGRDWDCASLSEACQTALSEQYRDGSFAYLIDASEASCAGGEAWDESIARRLPGPGLYVIPSAGELLHFPNGNHFTGTAAPVMGHPNWGPPPLGMPRLSDGHGGDLIVDQISQAWEEACRVMAF